MTWMENLRLWISQTVLVRLVAEIDETNEHLVKLGLKEVQIHTHFYTRLLIKLVRFSLFAGPRW